MEKKQKEICRTIQIILWLWFGIITSFVAVNVVNIVRLEIQINNINHELEDLENRHLLLKYNTQQK